MATATYIKTLNGFTGNAELYQLDVPLGNKKYEWDDEEPPKYEYVVVSATYAMFSGPETYIFGADSEGVVVDWGELPGSYRGSRNIRRALEGAGYEVVRSTE